MSQLPNITEQLPDTLKVITAASAPLLTVFGMTVEEWAFILSAIASIVLVIERIPMVINRFRMFKSWIRKKTGK